MFQGNIVDDSLSFACSRRPLNQEDALIVLGELLDGLHLVFIPLVPDSIENIRSQKAFSIVMVNRLAGGVPQEIMNTRRFVR